MPMTDTFENHARSLTSPPEHGAAMIPDDASDLPFATRAIYVGGAGDLALRLLGGGQVVHANVPAGTLLPIRAARVLASGTTAAHVVGFW
jgi:hypothetical protein